MDEIGGAACAGGLKWVWMRNGTNGTYETDGDLRSEGRLGREIGHIAIIAAQSRLTGFARRRYGEGLQSASTEQERRRDG